MLTRPRSTRPRPGTAKRRPRPYLAKTVRWQGQSLGLQRQERENQSQDLALRPRLMKRPRAPNITGWSSNFLDPGHSSCSSSCCYQFSRGPKIPKAFLIRSGAQRNFACTFILTLPTDLLSDFSLITPPPVGGRGSFLAISLFLCQQHYEKTAGLICMKFSGKVWSDHETT